MKRLIGLMRRIYCLCKLLQPAVLGVPNDTKLTRLI